MPLVLNKRTDKIPSDAIYVGRPSKWGNPFSIGKDGTREEVLQLYKDWIKLQVANNLLGCYPRYFDKLRGKDLVCWCTPLPCHADVLMELANATE